MSEKENIARVVAMYEAFGRGDIAFIVHQLREDVRWVAQLDPAVPWAGVYAGKQEVPKFFERIAANAETTEFTPRDFIAQGDTVVSVGEYSGKLRSNGKAVSTRWVFLWKFHEGQVAAYEQFHDGALAAAFR